VEQERAGLLRIWAAAPSDARSATRLGSRLAGLFRDEAWLEKAFDQLELRLKRLGRMFWEIRNVPSRRRAQRWSPF
jgi:hypothetical protein